MEYRTRLRERLGLNSIRSCDPDGTVLASGTSSRGTMLSFRYSARVNGSNGGPVHPFWMASKTNVLAFWVIMSIGLSSPASIKTEGFVQCPCSLTCNLMLLIFPLGLCVYSTLVLLPHSCEFHGDLHGQRSSISFMIASAHRTASVIAATVAGTRFPPSHCASFRAARIAAMMPMTRLRPSSTQAV